MNHVPGDKCGFCGVGTWQVGEDLGDGRSVLACSAVCGAPEMVHVAHGQDQRLETCPECGYFYLEGAEICIECGAGRPLVQTGNCYESALLWMIRHGGKYTSPLTEQQVQATLVHGWPTGTGGEAKGLVYGHAWIEYPVGEIVMCLDTEKDVAAPAAIFYAVGRIDPAHCHHYTWEDMQAAVLAHETYGPWAPGPEGSL